jgi:hypothetical protein
MAGGNQKKFKQSSDMLDLPSGDSHEVCYDKKLKLEVMKIDGPKSIYMCCPAIFRVKEFTREPTKDELKSINWDIKDEKENIINYKGEKKGSILIVNSLPPDCIDKKLRVYSYFEKPSENASVATKADVCEVFKYISLVQKVEDAYSDWPADDILNSVRRLAGYDDDLFLKIYGNIPKAKNLKPQGNLTQDDLDKMEKWSNHNKSPGFAKDCFGNPVAVGHVLTGISAGQHPVKNAETYLLPGSDSMFKFVRDAAWNSITQDRHIDNLFATTISGDLGQAASLVALDPKKLDTDKIFTFILREETDCEECELIGDIDGFLIGKLTPKGSFKLSEILRKYYCLDKGISQAKNTLAMRFQEISKEDAKTLLEQVIIFGICYFAKRFTDKYGKFSLNTQIMALVIKYCSQATIEFLAWLNLMTSKEKSRNKLIESGIA